MVKGNNVLRMAGVALAVAVAGLAGCNGAVYYHEAPPPHAPAYGYRWNAYDYFYYPSVGVYFHIPTGYYYYRDGRAWRRSQWLPPRIVILPRERVHVRIQDKEPWRRDKELHQRYRTPSTPRLSDRERNERNRVEREQNQRLYREYRQDGQRDSQRDSRTRDRRDQRQPEQDGRRR